MATKLIELEDGNENGLLVEVEIPGDQVEAISGGAADKVKSAIDKIKPILLKTCKPITEVWKELDKDVRQKEICMSPKLREMQI